MRICNKMFRARFKITVAQPFRAASAAVGRPKGLRYEGPRVICNALLASRPDDGDESDRGCAAASRRGRAACRGRRVDLAKRSGPPDRNSWAARTIGWPGAYGGWWQADPNDGSVLIFLAHNMVDLHQMAGGIGLEVWSAIVTFHGIARA